MVLILVAKLLWVSILASLTWGLIPLVWVASQIYGRPPNMAHFSQCLRYLRYTWTEHPSDPSLKVGARIWLTLCIVEKLFISRITGLAWLIDEVLYGKQLAQVEIKNPFFVISGGRSGSTQITRYLEEDPNLIAPNILMCMFPYLWLWKLMPYTLGLFLTKDQVREKIVGIMPKEALERHEEMDPFRADTFDGAFFSHHCNTLALHISPTVGSIEFSLAEFAPHNRHLVEHDYVELMDGVGRKTLLYHGIPEQNNNAHRFYLKGHFLLAAPALAKKYSNHCTMLTVVRHPLKRIESGINFLYYTPGDPYLGRVHWGWLTQVVVHMESRYCEVEQEWFGRDDNNGMRKCVIRFDDYTQDLAGTMAKVYKVCCTDDPVPERVLKMEHTPRNRAKYSVENRTLEELGVDRVALKRRLSSYVEWMNSIKK